MASELHGLVTMEPEILADTVIKRLHLRHFKGRRVAVRRYYIRSLLNDRRRNQEYNTAPESHNRRFRDRRREDLEFFDNTRIRIISFDNLSRKMF